MKRIAYNLILGITILLVACNYTQNTFGLKNGDLLFSVGEGGSDLLIAIQNSTSKEAELPFSHVGIVKVENDGIYVLEATTNGGVVKTELDSFLSESANNNGKYLVAVGRLKPPYQYTIPNAISIAEKNLGKEYDYEYDENNDSFYCSELIRYSFTDSLGKAIFEPLAMSFSNKAGTEIDPYWVEHFEKLNIPVPEGQSGTNPVDMSKSPTLEIVYTYY